MEANVKQLLSMSLLACSITPLWAGKLPLSVDLEVEGVSYSKEIPTPQQVLGYMVGTRHSAPHEIVVYFDSIAKTSDRVKVGRHGVTYEDRPLIHAIVTSASNHSKLEQLRLENLRLSEIPSEVPDQEIRDLPAFVTMGYSVHGNEASGSEAALLLLYHLAAGQGASVEGLLDQLVVIIDPMLNPDGRNRFVNWVNGNRGRVATSDPQDREHREPWPGGRTNHYWFDLNRDWLPAQLKETRGRLSLFHHWRPQVLTDFHEMGSDSTYFFQPGIPSRVNPLTPKTTSELTARIASYHARALDSINSLYYTEETFDDFYYGKGSTYPDINGAVGILFEQATSRSLQRSTNTRILRYDFTIRNQTSTSLSTLAATADLRRELLQHQRDFYSESLRKSREGPVKAYVFDRNREGRRGQELIEILLCHRIRVYSLAQDLLVDGEAYQPGDAAIVPTHQPQARLLHTIMEPVTEFEDTSFYDVSAWTLPLALGVTVGKVDNEIAGFLGAEIKQADTPAGYLKGGKADYAYLMEWGDFQAPKALHRIQREGISARFLTKPITMEVAGQSSTFAPATIVIPLGQQEVSKDTVHATINEAIVEDGARVWSVSTGLTERGPDLGGPSARIADKPSIALLSGPGTNRYQVGETWFLLNQRLGIPVSLIAAEDMGRLDLSRYNTLVMPPGSYGEFSEDVVDELRNWIRSGGLLVALGEAVRWLIKKEVVDERLKEIEQNEKTIPYSDVSKTRNREQISGAILRVGLDTTHPVAYGLSEEAAVLRSHTIFVEASKEPGANVALYSSEPLLSGYVSQGNQEHLKGTASILARRVGSGTVVLFVDNPNFRAFWHGTSALFLNAVFFGRSL